MGGEKYENGVASAWLVPKSHTLAPSFSTQKSLHRSNKSGVSKRTNPAEKPRKQTSLNMVGGAAVATAIALPKLSTVIATTLGPTLLGFYKYEYGVSYAYGAATAGTSALILRSILSSSASAAVTPLSFWAQAHAAAIVFYGIRLNLFLLYREVFLARFRKMRETIEEKRTSSGAAAEETMANRITSRLPFVLGCAFLYAGLAAPAWISGSMAQIMVSTATSTVPSIELNLYKLLVCFSWFGFGLGALGDFNKSLIKAKKGEDHLVTGGIYRFFRHPNYTGEVIGWTSSFLAAIVSIFASSHGFELNMLLKKLLLPLITSVLGLVGILFVLLGATAGLEKKQKEKYGETDGYRQWVETSWKGFSK
jgi:protein-S-isoprenylcysteine O-methyltransferase Ste14